MNENKICKIEKEYDLIVIGSGPGGYLAAEEAATCNLRTLIIEKEFWGGVCLNVGCIPTKALLKTIEVNEYVHAAHDYGIDIGKINSTINWKRMHDRKSEVVNKLTSGVQALLKGNKVEMIFGNAKFESANTVEVNEKFYQAKNIIIATGSSARKLPVEGFEKGYKEKLVLTSKEAINLKEKPKTMTIIGGGVIGVEFAQVFSGAGVEVTLLQDQPTILANLDKDVIKEITSVINESDIKLKTNVKIIKLEGKTLHYEIQGESFKIESDKILVSIGRVPLSLNLQKAGIKIGPRNNVEIDLNCRTNVPGVYAIGDVVGQSMLAHTAYKHATVAIADISKHESNSINRLTIPACIYTHPEVAAIGLTEVEAKDLNKDYIVARHDMKIIGKAIASSQTKGFAKFIIEKKYGEILGCHIVGQHATDMISEIAVAMDSEISIYEIAMTVHPHPTFSEVIWEAARKAVHKLKK